MKKKIVIAMLAVLVVCFLVMGIVFGKVQEANQPVQVYSGYIENGKFVSSNNGGVIGGSKEKEASAKTLSTLFYILSGVSGVGLVASVLMWRDKE